ncbi:Aste57867_7554 [Aphanomyces stellatus]|uniref:Aste57867_7554 protein n=1 Tax=Aphanomyces stellatus TaxID=120398 RepID=A0A485KII6_9STRA|nr:hypothetical protein As57867_007528 [Aphanomyces stellatus]VFT84463.1 Aste57867_7554 [Aphanomyces stellatus]
MVYFRFLALAASAVLATASKISPVVLRALERDGASNAVVYFKSVDPEILATAESSDDSRTTLVKGLIKQSQSAQSVVDSVLGERITSDKQEFFFIDNTFHSEAPLTADQIQKLAQHPDVVSVTYPVVAELFPVETIGGQVTNCSDPSG